MLDFSFQNFRNLTGSVGEVKFNSSCIYCQINHEFKMVFFWGGEKREWFLHADYRLGYFCWSISCLFLSRVDRKNHLIRANLYFFLGGGVLQNCIYFSFHRFIRIFFYRKDLFVELSGVGRQLFSRGLWRRERILFLLFLFRRRRCCCCVDMQAGAINVLYLGGVCYSPNLLRV